MSEGLIRALGAGLALWPGVFLLVGGALKLPELRGSRAGAGTILARMLPGRIPLRPVWGVVGAVELAAGALVLSTLFVPWPEAAAALLLAGATYVAIWGIRNEPEANCGCFGSHHNKVSPKTAIRAGLLAAYAALAAVANDPWTAVIEHPAAILVTLAAGVAVALVSPERTHVYETGRESTLKRWNVVLWRVDRARQAACERRTVPLERTVARLRDSDLWARARPFVSGEAPTEHWEEGCWRVMTYPAVYDGQRATAVFKVNLGRRQSDNGVVFVNEEEQKILGRIEADA